MTYETRRCLLPRSGGVGREAVPQNGLPVTSLINPRNGGGNPPSEGAGTTDQPDGPGSALAIKLEAAPSARETACLAKPQMEAREENAFVTPVPDDGVGAGTIPSFLRRTVSA